MKLIVFDIDGVLTDGCLYVDETGRELKRINLKDIDAVFELKRLGYIIGAITGERTPITNYFEKRIDWDYFEKGCKQKANVLRKWQKELGLTEKQICYIGDGKYDIEPIKYAGLGVCPADAICDVLEVADVTLKRPAGCGGLWELIQILDGWVTR